WLAQRILRLQVSDPVSGYFVMRREVFYLVAAQMNPKGFKILMEILYRSKIKNVQEIPYTFGVRVHGVSKWSVYVGWEYLVSIYDLLFGKMIPIRFLRFCLVGLSGVAVNGTILFFLLRYTNLGKDVALLAAIGTAMIGNYLLNHTRAFVLYRLQSAYQI